MGRAFVGLALGSTLGCASTSPPPPPRIVRLKLAVGDVVLQLERPDTEATLAWLEPAVRAAADRTLAFGLRLREPVTLAVHPTVRGFVDATGKTQPWLRAWAGWAKIDLLGLRFWEDRSARAQRERVTHELSHCAMFQAFGRYERAVAAHIPWWFLEGAASVIADQAASRMPLVEVLDRAQDRSPLRASTAGEDHALAYGAAHHAVALLVARHGPGVIARVLRSALSEQCNVETALSRTTGETAASLWAHLNEGA